MNEKFLKDLGLSQYESFAYSVLVKRQRSTATAISYSSEVPQQKIYAVLQSLKQKGLLIELEGRPKQFEPIAPKMALRALAKKQIEKFQMAAEKAVKSLENQNVSKEKETEKAVSIYVGERQRFSQEMLPEDRAEKEFLFFIEPPRLPVSTLYALKKAVQRGVTVKGILTNPNQNPSITHKLNAMKVPLHLNTSFQNLAFWVVDQKECKIVLLHPNRDEIISLHIKNASFSKALAHFFESIEKHHGQTTKLSI